MDADHLHEHPDGHRGWVRPGGRRGRWIEPFLLLLVAEGETHGYALIAALNELCVAPEAVDAGMAYRALREFESEGLVHSRWLAEDGAPRRTYRLTEIGRQALTEWIGVMRERARLTSAFLHRAEGLGARQGG
jgi:PadR family transcriptional regulator, regulatory protein PadR